MATEFMRLYRELERITPSTTFDEDTLARQRNDVMHRLGYKGMGGGQKYTRGGKHHGIRAREGAHEARQAALLGESSAQAQRRMQVHEVVHKVEHLNGLARELSKFVEAKKPVPGSLMRKLVGGDAMRRKTKQDDEEEVGGVNVGGKGRFSPTVPRETRKSRRDFTTSSWSVEERALLNRLYLETPKPTVQTKLDSWRVFYESVGSKFVAFFPHRTMEESIAKLEDMINRRVMKEVGEREFWEQKKHSLSSPSHKSHPHPTTSNSSSTSSSSLVSRSSHPLNAKK